MRTRDVSSLARCFWQVSPWLRLLNFVELEIQNGITVVNKLSGKPVSCGKKIKGSCSGSFGSQIKGLQGAVEGTKGLVHNAIGNAKMHIHCTAY